MWPTAFTWAPDNYSEPAVIYILQIFSLIHVSVCEQKKKLCTDLISHWTLNPLKYSSESYTETIVSLFEHIEWFAKQFCPFLCKIWGSHSSSLVYRYNLQPLCAERGSRSLLDITRPLECFILCEKIPDLCRAVQLVHEWTCCVACSLSTAVANCCPSITCAALLCCDEVH